MLLAIDLGNTSCAFAVMRGKKVIRLCLISSKGSIAGFTSLMRKEIKKIHREYKAINRVVLCSVVPRLNRSIKTTVMKNLVIKLEVVGEDITVPIKNKYHNPKQVGMDRLVCAYAASHVYGNPVIVIDLGTAITFDVISKNGDYEGGLIVPGIQLSVESLFSKTALLPHVDKIKTPKNLIGKDTKESILSGIFNGYGAMCSGLIDQLSKDLKPSPKVIITGGYVDKMRKYMQKKIFAVERNLVFIGLYLLTQD